MASNTILSDINEIYTGFLLAGKKWFDAEAKRQYNTRLKQAKVEEIKDAQGKSEAMSEEFISWAKKNNYKLPIKDVWWTARPGSMQAAVGQPVDQRKNPTDILVKFASGPANGFLGLSAKATKGQGDIGFKNPGLGTIDKNLNMDLGKKYEEQLQEVIKLFSLEKTAEKRKLQIRSNPGIKQKTEEIGVKILAAMRDELFIKLSSLDNKKLKNYLISDWMDAEVIYPPYIKVTGQGNKPPYRATVMDPLENEKLSALSNYDISLEKVGNESIGVKAGDKKIMKIRFKFESEKMASSVKLSGDPW